MTVLEEFENTLKEVVNAKRLSASKMNKLTEIVMKSLNDDTKLVATLYRTHKSLPSSAKVSSLYVFDALARAARSSVNKRGITGDINSAKGNAATFLLKIEGILEGLFHDMVSTNNSEVKEKAKKVLDIWAKSNTFPSAVLAHLGDILSDVRKENAVNPTSIDPRVTADGPATITTSQPIPPTPATSPPDVQATLLALLGQAAQITGQIQPPGQTPPNSTDPQLQQTQFALLQQLALTAKLASGSPTPPPGPTPPPTDKNHPPTIPTPQPIPTSAPSQTGGSCFDKRGDVPSYGRNGHPDRGRDRHDFRDERHPRGGSRGGYRGRGRWEDHYSRDHFGRRDRDLPPRPRRSRSRSPRRYEERRNVRPPSPPRRFMNDRPGPRQPDLPAPPSAHGLDEFGRDIRASSGSPSRSMSVEDTKAPAPMDSSVEPTPGAASDYHTPVSSDPLPSVAASTSVQSTETHTPSSVSHQQEQPGLDQFDITTFNATAPSSWEGLGNMWQTTHGYPPSQEELMHFVMAGSIAAAGMTNGGLDNAQGGQWQQEHWEEHRHGQGPQRNGGWRGGRGRGYIVGGRGGHEYCGDGDGYTDNMDWSEPSYAVVLNGSDEQADVAAATDNQQVLPIQSDEVADSTPNAGQSDGGGSSDRIQRVGESVED